VSKAGVTQVLLRTSNYIKCMATVQLLLKTANSDYHVIAIEMTQRCDVYNIKQVIVFQSVLMQQVATSR